MVENLCLSEGVVLGGVRRSNPWTTVDSIIINTIPFVVIDKTSISRSGLASVNSLLTYVVCIMANSLSLVPDTSFIFILFLFF